MSAPGWAWRGGCMPSGSADRVPHVTPQGRRRMGFRGRIQVRTHCPAGWVRLRRLQNDTRRSRDRNSHCRMKGPLRAWWPQAHPTWETGQPAGLHPRPSFMPGAVPSVNRPVHDPRRLPVRRGGEHDWGVVGPTVAGAALGATWYTSMNSLAWTLADSSRRAYATPMVIGLVGSTDQSRVALRHGLMPWRASSDALAAIFVPSMATVSNRAKVACAATSSTWVNKSARAPLSVA